MRRFGPGIAGAILLAICAGCSDTGTQDGVVPFKKTDAGQFTSMKNQMAKNVKEQTYTKPPTEGSKSAGESKKPAAEAKPAEPPKPADQTKPADQAKPASDVKSAEKKE
jgi:hypothetical protein